VNVSEILDAYKTGNLTSDEAEAAITGNFYQDLGHSTIDTDRQRRTGAHEVIYGEHKTPAQIAELVQAMRDGGQNVMVTRTSQVAFDAVQALVPEASFHADAGLITCVNHPPETQATHIAVVTAGTSDLPVAEEAALTAEFLGSPVARVADVGVAGVHRLLARVENIRSARVVVVVAGMEGALPSVVGGLVDKPVIAVPTSIGYGASFSGIAALLGMLNSCASGVSVVNIDNGFGAGFLAHMINRL
jgi:NCAIR mutase (PurE)-related protein